MRRCLLLIPDSSSDGSRFSGKCLQGGTFTRPTDLHWISRTARQRTWGRAMSRRTKAGGEPAKTKRRKTVAPKRNLPKARRPSTSGQENMIARLTRELAEAREAEQQVLHSSAQFAILVQNIKDYAIYMLDKTGRIISWNSGAERIKGYTSDEIIGQHFSRFYTDLDQKSGLPTKALRQAAADGKFEGEGWRVRKDGSQFWASVVIDPIHDDSGTLIGFAKVTRDVTERRQAQTKLQRERDNKLMNATAIVAAIAHEIRQPLTRIIAGGNAARRFLKMVPSEHDKAEAALDGIVNAGHRTNEIIDGFRALFGKDDQRQQLLDLNEVIRSVVESLSSDFNDHHVEPRTNLTAKLPHVYGNKSQLQEVIFNLISNAIEAMETTSDRSRVLLVKSELSDHQAVAVVVKDSGPGIDKDRLEGIFTTFVSTKHQ